MNKLWNCHSNGRSALVLAVLWFCIAYRLAGQQSSYLYDAHGNLLGVAQSILAAPAISAQPQPSLLNSNTSVSLAVVASGVGLSYQWRSNGVAILGATNDSLVFSNLSGGNLTNFTVIISNAMGVITSAPVAIWIDANGNGIPDWWEMQYFGNLNQLASGDYDGDGVSNIDEYSEGTNPANSASFHPRLTIAKPSYGQVIVTPDQPYYTNGQVVTLTAVPDDGEQFLGWSGAATGTKTSISIVMNAHKSVAANFGVPLPQALDNSNLVWTTGGAAPWFGQGLTSYDTTNSAQSGLITDSQQSWLQGVVSNLDQTYQLHFWWNVSCQSPDNLAFSLDGAVVKSISGESGNWQSITTNLSIGAHTLLWTFSKDGSDLPTGIPFADNSWVDQVTLTALPTPPIITNQPASQNVFPGSLVTFSVAALGSQPLRYQWYLNGVLQSGQTNTAFQISAAQPGLSTVYVSVANTFGSTNSALASLTVNSPTCTNAPSGLISWWSAEGNAFDAVGTNHGQIMGSVAYVTGKVGSAFALNDINGYVKIADSPSLHSLTNAITIETWIFVNQFDRSWQAIVTKGDSAWRLARYGDNSSVEFGTSGLSNLDLGGNKNVVDGQWHHVAAVYDGSKKLLYVDGVLDASTVVTGSINLNNYPVCIGENAEATGRLFNGKIDEVSIYNRALSSNEITAIYLTGSYGKCIHLAAVPRFDTAPGHFSWTGNGVQLWINGSSVQRSVTIYATTNLTIWSPLATIPAGLGPFQFFDSTATNYSQRFYRAIISP